ncbi:SWIB-domain-containing protein [Backusella circina FSU 941]|nr:SWIB-domain-containing protein [Backusella circina FSU 941]
MASGKDECVQYRKQIVAMLESTDLSIITAKSIRRALEALNQVSLDHIKSEMNEYIMELYKSVEAKQNYVLPPEETVKRKDKDIKKVVKKTIKKKNKDESKEKKVRNAPVVRIKPPLSIIIGADICSRPQAVKKMWEYIRQNNLQDPNDKRIIVCDANFKALCDGEDRISGFAVNKHLQKCYEKVPEEEQALLRQQFRDDLLREEDTREDHD